MKPRLLIADDDSELRAWIRLVLRRLDAEVLEAKDGIELSSLLREGGPFDLIVTDIRMPGKSGFEVVSEARRAGVSAAVVLLSGYSGDVPRSAIERMGNAVLLSKPVEGDELLAAIRALLARPAFGR
jgi:DNA-binding response OmpR family regulator